MSLVFRNASANDIYTAWGMYYPKDCAGRGNFVVKGWFLIRPGESGVVSTDDIRGSEFWAYAEDAYGNFWGGGKAVCTTQQAFDICVGDRVCLKPDYFAVFPRESNNHLVSFNP